MGKPRRILGIVTQEGQVGVQQRTTFDENALFKASRIISISLSQAYIPSKLSNLAAKASKADITEFSSKLFYIHILYSFCPVETSRRTEPGGTVNRPVY